MKHILDNYKQLREQKGYLTIIIANMINRFGDSIDQIALLWVMYEISHSAIWSTIFFGVNMLPTILFQPFAGAWVEQRNKKTIMVWMDILRGICVSCIAGLFLFEKLTPILLIVFTFLMSSFEALRVPAGISIVPMVLEEQVYDVGISSNASLSRIMELVGTGCAGFIVAVFGSATAIFIDAITFFLSGLIINFIKYQEVFEDVGEQSFFKTFILGLNYVKSNNLIVILCIFGALANVLLAPLNALLPVYIDNILHQGSESLSMLSLAISLGSIIGSLMYSIIISKISNKMLLMMILAYISLFYVGIMILPQVFNDIIGYEIVLGLFMMMGIISAFLMNYLAICLTKRCDHRYLARVGAVFNSCASASLPIVSMIITIALIFVSFTTIFYITAVLSGICILWLVMDCKTNILDEVEKV